MPERSIGIEDEYIVVVRRMYQTIEYLYSESAASGGKTGGNESYE